MRKPSGESQGVASPGKEHRLHFPQLERTVDVRAGESVYQAARRHGIRVVGACGGRGTCGSCVVRLVKGKYARLNREHAGDTLSGDAVGEDREQGRRWLRACQIRPASDGIVEIAPRSLAPVVRTDTDRGEAEFLDLAPVVEAIDLSLPVASLDDSLSDVDRVLRGLAEAGVTDSAGLTVDAVAARGLADCLRASEARGCWSLRAWRRGANLMAFTPIGQSALGLAVDLGTTNVAAFLVNLETGERVVALGVENPQTAWGADLISRINHAIRDAGALDELQAAVVEGINALAQDLCRGAGRRADEILDVALCGNTAMHHLLLGLPVRTLGRAPFVAVLRDSLDLPARELGIAVAPGAALHLAPNIGGFVGGDHVTALLATEDRWQRVGTAVVMDIGTNTEISLIHRGGIRSASAPSGPALEGGHVSCGMRAAEGAIERVWLAEGRLRVATIGDRPAIGLCGSGVLDTLAILLRGGVLNRQGRLVPDHPDIVLHQGKRAVRLAEGVHFTQDDVRAVQLAKAAIRTATELLLDDAGIAAEEVAAFIIAGSFGAYIDVASGIEIGLFPSLPQRCFQQVGNAAGVGIRRMLASRDARARARELARACRFVELSSRGDFQKTFLRHIGFPTPMSQGYSHDSDSAGL